MCVKKKKTKQKEKTLALQQANPIIPEDFTDSDW